MTSPEKILHVLIVEDLPSDAELAKREVKKVLTNSTFKVADTEKDYVQALKTFSPDIIISDYQMPTFDGMTALKIRQKISPITPFIMLTGSMNEAIAVECMKAGADDYVIKSHIKRLGQAVLGALEKKNNEQKRRLSEHEMSQHTEEMTLINNINEAIIQGKSLMEITKLISNETKRVFNSKNTTLYLVSDDKKYLEMQNLYLLDSIAKPLEKIIGSRIPEIRIPLKDDSISYQLLHAGEPRLTNNTETIQKWMLEFTETTFLSDKLRQSIRKLIVPIFKLMDIQSVITIPLVSKGQTIGLLDMSSKKPFTEQDMKRIAGVAGQLTIAINRLRAEKKIEEANKIINSGPAVAFLWVNKRNHPIEFVSDNVQRLIGYPAKDFIEGKINYNQFIHKEDHARVSKEVAYYSKKEECISYKHEPYRIITKNGDIKWVDDSTFFRRNSLGEITHYEGIVYDITEQKLTENAIQDSELKYRKFFMEDLTGDYLSTREGKIIDCNPEFLRIFGFKSLKEAQDYDPAKLHGSKQIREAFINKLEKEKILTNEISELFRKDGKKIIIQENVSGEFSDDGKLLNLKGYVYDITERVKAEKELIKLSTAVEQSPLSHVITDTEGKIEYVNPTFEKLTGYSFDEAVGQNPSILKSGVKSDNDYRKLWETISQGKVWAGEFLNKKKNGELYWESATISPVKDKKGKTTNYLAIKEDITEQKSNISELMDREEKYRTLTQNLNAGVYRSTPGINGIFLEANPAFLKMFGFRNKNELERYKVSDLYPDLHYRQVIEEKLRVKGFLMNEEIQLRKKDGVLFYASESATAAKDELGKITHYDGIIEDITEQKKMLDEIIQERDKSQIYLDIAGVMFLALDIHGSIVLANQKTCDILKAEEKELIGKNWFDNYLPTDLRSEVKELFIAIMKGDGKIGKYNENEIVTVAGDRRLISWHNSILKDESGTIIGIISSGLDITEKKEEEELRAKLYETSRYLAESLDLNTVLNRMSKQARALLKANGVTIYMLEEDKYTLNPVSAYDPPYTKQILATKISIDNSLTGQAIKAKIAQIFNNNEKAKGAFHIKGTPLSDKDNIIVSPLKIDDIIIGALTLVREGIPFTEKELIIVNTFAMYASTAIKNANIHKQLLSEIDDRKQTQILLKDSHDRYESIFDGATDGIIYTDWDGKIISVNPAAVKLLGVTQKNMIGSNAIEIAKNKLSDESLDRMLKFIKKALKGDAISNFLVRTNKEEFVFNTTYGKGKPGLTVIIRDVTERNKTREKINLHQKNLQLLTSELTMVEEKARRRLAITLHDKLGQSLVLAKFKTNELIKQTKDFNQIKVIDEITSFIEDAIKESRSITYELSPPVLYEMGLISAISWKLDEIEKSSKLKTSLIDQSKSYEIEKREEIILYRTINELLQNTIKHAKSKNVNVIFRLLKDKYRIIVSDNGIGFDLKTMRERAVLQKKFGLFSVIERIKYIGGEVNIDTAHNKGTKVVIDLPIKN